MYVLRLGMSLMRDFSFELNKQLEIFYKDATEFGI